MRPLTVVRRLAVRLAVAVLVAPAAALGASDPAQAATCSSAHGVSVVVDFHQLGGGVQTACDAGGAGKYADAQFADVGHTLTYVQRQPGFVCRVDGAPSSDPCVNTPPADAYWSLWWSDGRSGTWSYASTGVGSLKVPEGGYVALSWQGGKDRAKPGVAPKAHPADPTSSPTTRPPSTPHPSSSTGPGQPPPSSTAPGASVSSTPTATPGTGRQANGRHGKQPHAKPSKAGDTGRPSHRPGRTQAAGPVGAVASGGPGDASGSGSGGLPGWVAPIAIAVLFVGAGTIVLIRRRSSGET